jgi:hypothetical protein
MPELLPQIEIEVNPLFFVFSWKIHKRKVATLVAIDTKTKDLIAIGEAGAGEDVVTVTLFEPCEALPPDVEKTEMLQTFLEFNIAKMLEKQKVLFTRPKIVFREDQSLKGLLCGYQRSILKAAALAAGAREVLFE